MPIKTNKPVVPLESNRIDNVDPNSPRGQSRTFKRVKHTEEGAIIFSQTVLTFSFFFYLFICKIAVYRLHDSLKL